MHDPLFPVCLLLISSPWTHWRARKQKLCLPLLKLRDAQVQSLRPYPENCRGGASQQAQLEREKESTNCSAPSGTTEWEPDFAHNTECFSLPGNFRIRLVWSEQRWKHFSLHGAGRESFACDSSRPTWSISTGWCKESSVKNRQTDRRMDTGREGWRDNEREKPNSETNRKIICK